VQRLGVDRVLPWPGKPAVEAERRRLCLLAVGRLHRVKDYGFLIRACASLRDQGLDFLCWIVVRAGACRAGTPIAALGLQGHVSLIGQVPRADLPSYYRHADLVVMTSQSEGFRWF